MVKQKIKEVENIKKPGTRQRIKPSFAKRKQKILKLSMELSILFKKEILVSIMDEGNMTLYSSSKQSSNIFKANLMNPKVKKHIYTNTDVRTSCLTY
jgi:hypothetical protein